MSEIIKHIVKPASRGGWNKMHIWAAVQDYPDYPHVRLLAICRKGALSSPGLEWWPVWWVNNHADMPLEKGFLSSKKYADHCVKCEKEWDKRKEEADAAREAGKL